MESGRNLASQALAWLAIVGDLTAVPDKRYGMAANDTLTTGQAARILGVADRTVFRWAERGAFAGAVRMGGRYRIPRPEVERVKREGFDLSALDREAA